MNPRQAFLKKQEDNKKLFLPKEIELAVNLIHSFIKNNNIIGLKIAILLSGARDKIDYDEDNRVCFDVDELCNIINTDRTKLSKQLKSITETKYSFIDVNGDIVHTTPIHTTRYTRDNKKLYISVSSEARKLFTELGKGKYQFSKQVNSDNLMELKNKHSIRMQLFLEMINDYSDRVAKRIKLTLEDANDYFGVNYRNWYDFEQKILKPVKSEIDLSNKLSFVYQFDKNTNGIGRPGITEITIDLIDNSGNLFAN